MTKIPAWIRALAIGLVVAWWTLLAFAVVAPYFLDQPGATIGDQLLQVVLWSITTVFTIAGAILGLNWYQGERRYQEQREYLENIATKLSEHMDKFENELANQADMLKATVNDVEFLKGQFSEQRLDAQMAISKPYIESTIEPAIVEINKVAQRYQGTDSSLMEDTPNPYDDVYYILHEMIPVELTSPASTLTAPASLLAALRDLEASLVNHPEMQPVVSKMLAQLDP